MKIISGKYKGRKIEGYDMEGTRPTMDRVKESLFATIQTKIPNAIVLDLFSGSGNLGIEALSEGAKYAYLVDSNKRAIKTINNNLDSLKITTAKTICLDYEKALNELQEEKMDIIFLDPPYKTNYIEKSLLLIEKYDILQDNGIIVCESDTLDKIIYPNSFKEEKHKKYGDKYVVFLKKI